jgi:hypothetical protein
VVTSSSLTPDDDKRLPPECKAAEFSEKLPEFEQRWAMQPQMIAMNTQRMTREDFLQRTGKFNVLRATSKCRLLRMKVDLGASDFMVLTYRATSEKEGVCFATKWDASDKQFEFFEPDKLKLNILSYSLPKWIFLAFGIFGFVFLWRRGGDSSLARWLGIWLVGASLVPMVDSVQTTFPHMTHWLWQQSVMYHWNTLASALEPLFHFLYIATFSAVTLFILQVPAGACWIHICWPTRIFPQYPPIVRHLLLFAKLAAVIALQLCSFCFILVIAMIIWAGRGANIGIIAFWGASLLLFLVGGAVMRWFTHKSSEVSKLGVSAVLAMLTLNISSMSYMFMLMFGNTSQTTVRIGVILGSTFGFLFIIIMAYIILKRNFLHVRAIDGFTTLLLLMLIPFLINRAEYFVPILLSGTPFFHERGADLVAILFVLLIFPTVHHWLHELLLFISLPKLRKIEHTVEHALEAIVDAQTEADRAKMISELFDTLRVPRYLFFSRGANAVFNADINNLDRNVPPTIELSPQLRKFLGQRHRFVDLHTMAFEWRYFFHQFELHRIAQATGCRYLLPVSVGESLRALLLIPEGPGESVMANPAVSANINNFGIAAALSRPRS